jgi:glycosyltransferase involved in cell wall biosynthesis
MTSPGPSKPIKICYIAPKAYPIFNPDIGNYFGGVNVDLYYLATEMAKDKRFESSFIVADYGQSDSEVIEGVKLFKALDFSKGPFNGLIRTWRALKGADADIYFIECASPGVPLVALFCKIFKKIFVYRTAHIFECDGTYLRQHFLLGRAFAWSLRGADAVFVQNATDVENLQSSIGVSSHVIANGHRLPELGRLPRDTILWVGRDADFKKPHRFLDLANSFPGEHFTMVCQTLNDDQDYKNLVNRASAVANLQFIRHVPFNQIDTYFQRAKIFVNTSDAEGFPNTFVQACKCGTPILSFNVNPDGFLESNSCGLCCNGDLEKLSYNLRFMLENNRYLEFGSNARRYAEQYHDISKITETYKTVFLRLVGK